MSANSFRLNGRVAIVTDGGLGEGRHLVITGELIESDGGWLMHERGYQEFKVKGHRVIG